MELYNFLRGTLAWTATIACLWPVNAPLMALAFKIQYGPKTIDMENDEYWTRSFVTSLVLGLVTAAFIFFDFLIASEFPAGPTHLIVFVAYVPVAAWILTQFFAQDDLLFGLSMFVIYIFLPTLVLFVVNWLTGLWNPLLDYAYEWIREVT